ncbi:MAG: Histidine kinaselike ATPase domain [Solirubrobacteraceae bacterium]|nr:Histidine kinaselike ATPase domain [Solirubrobacteraceae bacterium]
MRARRAVRNVLIRAAVDRDAVDLAVSEALTDLVIHAYSDRVDADETGPVRLAAWLDEEGVSIVVADPAVAREPPAGSRELR